jgi:formylglycine-generating enzyme required for sulfatase activity
MAAGLKVAFCWIPDGRFMMGSPDDELGREHEESRQRVIISKGFWMTKTETTQALWKAVMGENPSLFKGDDLPVEMISWMDICGDNQRTGGFLGKVNAAAPKGWRFDLPSQAEWEYACRAKTETSLNSGENVTSAAGRCENLDQVGWYVGNSGGKTNPVGLKKPNHWGLHDMHGNVWEFCAGWNGEFPAGSLTDPTGPASGNERINRGGGWTSPPSKCRATRAKGGCKSDEKLQSLGFRLIIRPV